MNYSRMDLLIRLSFPTMSRVISYYTWGHSSDYVAISFARLFEADNAVQYDDYFISTVPLNEKDHTQHVGGMIPNIGHE